MEDLIWYGDFMDLQLDVGRSRTSDRGLSSLNKTTIIPGRLEIRTFFVRVEEEKFRISARTCNILYRT